MEIQCSKKCKRFRQKGVLTIRQLGGLPRLKKQLVGSRKGSHEWSQVVNVVGLIQQLIKWTDVQPSLIPTMWAVWDNQLMGLSSSSFNLVINPIRNPKEKPNVNVKWENASIQCVHNATTNCALMVAVKRIQVLNITRNSRSNWDSTAIEEMVKENKLIYSFDLTKKACFGVLPRYANIRWFELPNCFIFHNANAWEEEDEVVLITCRLENLDLDMINETVKEKFESFTYQLYEMRFNMKNW